MATTNIPCVYMVLRKGNKALFVLRSNTGFMDGFYGLPAGHVETSESFRAAAIRETEEEIGVVVKPKELHHLHTAHRYQTPENTRVDVIFEAVNWSGTPKNMEPDKHSKIEWLDLNNLPENVQDFTADALKHLSKKVAYSEFGWEQAK